MIADFSFAKMIYFDESCFVKRSACLHFKILYFRSRSITSLYSSIVFMQRKLKSNVVFPIRDESSSGQIDFKSDGSKAEQSMFDC